MARATTKTGATTNSLRAYRQKMPRHWIDKDGRKRWGIPLYYQMA